jgi:enoyl-[acyl-carrier protein] reductase II
MPPDLFEKEVDRCIRGVDRPFAVNLITIAPNYKAQFEVLRTKKVPFVVFAGSFPRKADIQEMKKAGKRTMSFASEESIAAQQIRFGIDSLILEGSEAGGHIGFVSLIILLQQVLFQFDQVPIFVGGGIARGRMIAHLLLMGAAGCQLGTRFVMSAECTAHDNFKKAFLKARARQAIATPQYDSKLPVVAVRAIKNKGTDEFGKLQLRLLGELEAGRISREKAQFEVENFWMGALRRAVVEGDVDYGSLMAGQSVGLIHEIKSIKEIIDTLVLDAEEELSRVRLKINNLS